MSKNPSNFNIIKHSGQVNEAVDLKGKTIKRADFLFVKLTNGEIGFVPVAYDPDHFIYQNQMPIPEDELITKYHGIVPKKLQGAHGLCTCGAEAVVMLEGPHAGMALCKSVAQLGKHQTSFQIKDNKLILDKKTRDEKLMMDSDIAKTMQSQEEKQEADLDAKTHHKNEDLEDI